MCSVVVSTIMVCQYVINFNGSSANQRLQAKHWYVFMYYAIFENLWARNRTKGKEKYLKPTDVVGCNYLSLSLIPASGTQALILFCTWHSLEFSDVHVALECGYTFIITSLPQRAHSDQNSSHDMPIIMAPKVKKRDMRLNKYANGKCLKGSSGILFLRCIIYFISLCMVR